LSRKNLERHKSQHYHNIMKNIQASEKGKINNIKYVRRLYLSRASNVKVFACHYQQVKAVTKRR